MWDVKTGQPLRDPVPTGGEIVDLAFDPSGRLLAGALNGPDPAEGGWLLGLGVVWDSSDFSERYRVDADSGYGRSGAVTFSPDGTLLVTGGGTGELRFWDSRTGIRSGRSVVALGGWVFSADFDPSGTTLVTSGTDGTTRLVDVASRSQIGAPFPGLDQRPSAAGYTPDGSQVVVIYETGLGYVWDVTPEGWSSHACDVAGRTLTREEWIRFLPDEPYAPACKER